MKTGTIVFDAAPFGLCPSCIEALGEGTFRFDRHPLPDGSELIACYCVHREAGATCYLAQGRPHRWLTVCPIDAIEFQEKQVPGEIAARTASIIAKERRDAERLSVDNK
jgi:hypothetical protein